MMGAHMPFMDQVLEACPSPHPRALEVCRDLWRHPMERAGPKFWFQHLLHP